MTTKHKGEAPRKKKRPARLSRGLAADGRLVLNVEEAGRLLGLSRNGSYLAARRGDLPTVRIGGRVLVPKAALMKLLESPERKTA